jgi:hypothetical protein
MELELAAKKVGSAASKGALGRIQFAINNLFTRVRASVANSHLQTPIQFAEAWIYHFW